MQSREQELEKLVKEQARDMKWGHISINKAEVRLSEELEAHLANDGFHFGFAISEYEKTGCTLHGREFLSPPSPAQVMEGRPWRCRRCVADTKQRWRVKHWDKYMEHKRAYERDYYKRPEVKERHNARRRVASMSPERVERKRIRDREYKRKKREAGA